MSVTWDDIDAVLHRHGYEVAARYASLGDCPEDVIALLGAAGDARHESTEDEGPPAPHMVQALEQMLGEVADDPPHCVPIRCSLTPSVTVYLRHDIMPAGEAP